MPRPFQRWLLAFYLLWGAVVLAGDHLGTVARHWPIALAMSAGSYVAGSTPMGGGTVGFPILVLLFGMPPAVGRGFSFAIQSVGMTSASIYILTRRQPVLWRPLTWALVGTTLGTPLGLLLLAPHVSDAGVKLVFSVLWASFGLMTLVKVREFAGYAGHVPLSPRGDRALGLAVGLLGGGTVSALTGVGVDMLIYTLLVLLCRADLKLAIPTSVILMAWTSLVGISASLLLAWWDPVGRGLSPEVAGNWLAAAPVVALGAPLGAFVVDRVGRRPTLVFVGLLCLGQLAWTWHDLRLPALSCLASLATVLLANGGFHLIYKVGERRAASQGASAASGQG